MSARVYASCSCAVTPSLISELNQSTIHSRVHPWLNHCHWSQSIWALCQDCHGPLTKLQLHTHIHTQMGPYKPLCVPWVFDPLSALVGRAIKGSTPTWEQYPSSPECPQISLCLTQSLALFSLLFPFVGLSRSLPFLSSSFYFSPFFLSLPITPFYFLHLDYFLVALSDLYLPASFLSLSLAVSNKPLVFVQLFGRMLVCLVDSEEYIQIWISAVWLASEA